MMPDYLCHYYEYARGPFLNLSDLPLEEADAILEAIRLRDGEFASQRKPDYLTTRRALEDLVRTLFIAKGGQPTRARPQYMILGHCDWVKSWYQQGCEVRIRLAHFDLRQVSFTDGDTFPAMNMRDGRPYRGRVCRLDELPAIIGRYGLPQDWNPDGAGGPERYIEAQVWDDGPLRPWLR